MKRPARHMRHPATPSDLLKRHADQFARGLSSLADGDVRALHRVRVASRRLRELVPVLPLPHDTSKKLIRRIRKVTTRLGSVRELDVLLLMIDELHVSRRNSAAALSRLGIAVSKQRNEARKR